MVDTLEKVVKANLCVSCGACEAMSTDAAELIEHCGVPLPQSPSSKDEFLQYCPGKGYDIVEMGKELFGKENNYDFELGYYNSFCAATVCNDKIATNASSGGIITAILSHLLDQNQIQGAVVTKFRYGVNGPRPEPYIATSQEDLLEAQGSKYCPVSTLLLLKAVESFPGKVAWVGTPCQIAALRLIQQKNKVLKDKVLFTIANFCGGYKSFREQKSLLKQVKCKPKNINFFRYRGGGQPGSMLIREKNGQKHSIPYPDYSTRTGFIKLKRCRLCVDAMGELADFSCGDAWLQRFINSDNPWSLVISRNNKSEKIINEMLKAKTIVTNNISLEELKLSQKQNLFTKKHRQKARQTLFKILNMNIPIFDGGINSKKTSLLLEIKISIQYFIFLIFQHLGLYPFLAKILKRWQ